MGWKSYLHWYVRLKTVRSQLFTMYPLTLTPLFYQVFISQQLLNTFCLSYHEIIYVYYKYKEDIGPVEDLLNQQHIFVDEGEYPDIGIYFGNCPSGGHDMIALDYRTCGPKVQAEATQRIFIISII
jgi:hypothetical protein